MAGAIKTGVLRSEQSAFPGIVPWGGRIRRGWKKMGRMIRPAKSVSLAGSEPRNAYSNCMRHLDPSQTTMGEADGYITKFFF